MILNNSTSKKYRYINIQKLEKLYITRMQRIAGVNLTKSCFSPISSTQFFFKKTEKTRKSRDWLPTKIPVRQRFVTAGNEAEQILLRKSRTRKKE